MKCTSPRHRSKSNTGFSLVEVTLSLAILSFGLVALLGLFPQGLQSSRDAADNTMAATIAQDILSQARALPFTTPAAFFGANITLATQSTGLEKYFDQDGFLTSGNVKGKSYYKVRLDFVPLGGTTTKITALVMWRVDPTTSSGGRNTNTFITQISYYDIP